MTFIVLFKHNNTISFQTFNTALEADAGANAIIDQGADLAIATKGIKRYSRELTVVETDLDP